MLRFGRVSVGEGAPLGCARCALPREPVFGAIDGIERALDALAADWGPGPGPNVLLTGPEPFAHPLLPALVGAAAAAGFERIALETDAAALSVPQNADGVLGAGVRHLFVRVITTDERRALELLPRPSALGDARTGIRGYLSAAENARTDVVVTAIVPVCVHSLAELPSTVADLARWGIHAVRLVAAGALPEGADARIAAACDTGMVNRLWVETDGSLPLPASHALHEVREGGDSD